MLTQLKSRLRRFGKDTDGYVTIEAMIILPGLIWLFAASWVYFDVFREQSINQKANYTIGDMLSRETDPITDEYIDNAYKLLLNLNKSEAAKTDLRITVVRYNAKNRKYQVVWSAARGVPEPLANNSMRHYEDRLPIMANNDQVIVVETWDDYLPDFRGVGLDAFDITTYSFTRPRFAPQILYSSVKDENNGWGNGDQTAPGGSLCNNEAENATDCENADGEENVEPSQDKGA
ncbi:TadE/TadG family type IV pilus assembly protein [Thalassococcus sp. BH17M4-6]|uniref:TadE/TadG family type IV pilus assembly protein n=1 Tax=Thalassococcus sp. BH17M4-6 TaxID=3413148 RepID=UPI003BC0795B